VTERVFITGLGVISSIGTGKDAFFASLEAGKSGITPVEAFDAARMGRKFGGEVKDFRASDHLARHEVRTLGRCSQMALAAARMAARDAGLGEGALAGPRVSVVMGTTMGDADVLEVLDKAFITQGPEAIRPPAIPRYSASLLPIHLARAFGAEGVTFTLPAACAAGNYSIGFAADLIRAGKADAVVAGASELLQQLQFAGFVKLQAMAPERCQPFDKNRHGILLGEGAGVLVLESESRAKARGARILAEVGAMGITCDGHHVTRPHPDAWGSVTAMRQAIDKSGITSADVDFVNAHGTGTKANDVAETKVMREVFGDRRVPISSMKSMLGHCMGAASALEAIGCVFTLERGVYPPTIGFETPDPECDVELVANVSRKGKADIVLNNSLAFGGYNAVVCLARPGVLPEPTGGEP
jgi:3-oxoacyl-[acyl-carrier-protein] synthase II